MAEYVCLDAAGDPYKTCEEHRRFNGGMLSDEDPIKLKYAETVRKIKEVMSSAG